MTAPPTRAQDEADTARTVLHTGGIYRGTLHAGVDLTPANLEHGIRVVLERG